MTEQQLLHTCLACNYAGAIKRYASSCIILTARALDVPKHGSASLHNGEHRSVASVG